MKGGGVTLHWVAQEASPRQNCLNVNCVTQCLAVVKNPTNAVIVKIRI